MLKPSLGIYLNSYWNQFQSSSMLVNSTYFFINTIIISVFGFLFWWFAIRLYPANSVGGYVVILSLSQVIIVVTSLGLAFGLIRFLPLANNKQKTEFINIVLTYMGGFTCGLSLVIVVIGLSLFSSTILSHEKLAVFIFPFVVSTSSLFYILGQVLVVLKAGKQLVLTNLTTTIGRIILVIILSPFATSFALILAFTLPTFLAVIIIIKSVLPQLISDYVPYLNIRVWYLKSMITYSISSYIGNVLYDLPQILLPQIVANRFGLAGAAYFYAIWSIYSVLVTLGNSISLALFVEGSHNPTILNSLAVKSMGVITAITILLAIIVVFLAKPILLIFGLDYADNGVALLRVMAVAIVPASIVSAKIASLRVKMQLSPIIITFALIVAINMAVLLISSTNSLESVGWIWLISQTVALIYLLLFTRSKT